MKQKSSNQKRSHRNPEDVDQAPSAGLNGIALPPPSYGIGSVDRGLTEAQVSRAAVTQRQADMADTDGEAGARSENRTGLPDNLKAEIEGLSGLALDNVRVHYNSPKPFQLLALAYTQGTDIHVAPGQERHLPHEAWHVVQQVQGRVKPTMQMKGDVQINDNEGLEHEAEVMGAKAMAEAQQYDALKVQEPYPGNFRALPLTKSQWAVNRKLAEKSRDRLYESNTASDGEHQLSLGTTTAWGQPIAQRYKDVRTVDFVHKDKSDFELMKTFYLGQYSQIQIFLNDLGRIKHYLDELNEYLFQYDKSLSDMLALLMPQWSRTILKLVGTVPQRPFIAEMQTGKLFEDYVDQTPGGPEFQGFAHGGVSHRLQWYLISKEFPADVLDLYKESFNPLWAWGDGKKVLTMWDLIVDGSGEGHDFTAPGALWNYVYKEYTPPVGKENRLRSNLNSEVEHYREKKQILRLEQREALEAKRKELGVGDRGLPWLTLAENSEDVFRFWEAKSGNRWSGWAQESAVAPWIPTIVQSPQSAEEEFEIYSVPVNKRSK